MKLLNTLNHQMSAALAIGRRTIAVLFLASAAARLMARTVTIPFIVSSGLSFAMQGFVMAVSVEAGGGLLLVDVIQTRGVAIDLAICSVVTGLVFHQFGQSNAADGIS